MNEEVYQEQGISFSDLLFLVKRNILVILIITIVCTIAGGIYAYALKEPVYTAVATAVVQAEQSTTNNSESTSYSYSVALTNTFKDVIKSQPVIVAAADELAKNEKYSSVDNVRSSLMGKLKSNVSVSSTTSTLILTVSAESTDPDEAILLANTILEQTIAVTDQYQVDENGNNKTDADGNPIYLYPILGNKLKVLQNADVDTTSEKHNELLILVVACLIGLIISFVIVLIKFLSDDTYTSKDTFEKTYNINILASIQDAEGGN